MLNYIGFELIGFGLLLIVMGVSCLLKPRVWRSTWVPTVMVLLFLPGAIPGLGITVHDEKAGWLWITFGIMAFMMLLFLVTVWRLSQNYSLLGVTAESAHEGVEVVGAHLQGLRQRRGKVGLKLGSDGTESRHISIGNRDGILVHYRSELVGQFLECRSNGEQVVGE